MFQCSVPGVGPKDSQGSAQRKALTLAHIEEKYPNQDWTYIFTDGSADQAVRNGGAGVYIKYPGGNEENISLATGCYSTNYQAEAVAIKTGAVHIQHSTETSQKVVFFSDALSVLQTLKSGKEKELNELFSALSALCQNHQVTLQWIPSHCDVQGNEKADILAKEGSTKDQVDKSTTYKEAKTIIKAKQHTKWLQQHPQHKTKDPWHETR